MSVLHNVVKTPATKIEVRPGMFKVTSRTDIPAACQAIVCCQSRDEVIQ